MIEHRLQLVTPPTFWALSDSDFEAHSRAMGQPVEQLSPYVQAATNHLEVVSNRRFASQTWRMYLDFFPDTGAITIPYSPLVSVAYIRYTDSSGVQRTFPSTEYGVSTARTPGQIILEYQKDWPTETLRHTDPIEIEFTCGWPDQASVPTPIRQAIRMLASHFYEHREAVVVGTAAAVDEAELPLAASALIAPWRVFI